MPETAAAVAIIDIPGRRRQSTIWCSDYGIYFILSYATLTVAADDVRRFSKL